MEMAERIEFRLPLDAASLDFSTSEANFGSASAARMPMIATTIISSISVNPCSVERFLRVMKMIPPWPRAGSSRARNGRKRQEWGERTAGGGERGHVAVASPDMSLTVKRGNAQLARGKATPRLFLPLAGTTFAAARPRTGETT